MKVFVLILLFLTSFSCQAQKMMKNIVDAKQLKINQQQFIGKPLTVLIAQIAPKIKYVYGNPDNKGESIAGTSIKFFFIDKNEYVKRKKEKPTGISITFKVEPNNTRMPIPIGGRDISKEVLLKEYRDMIVQSIYVTGEN